MSDLAQKRAEYRRKQAEWKRKKAGPAKQQKPKFCKYCKTEGDHVIGFFNKDTQQFTPICPALIANNAKKAARKAAQKKKNQKNTDSWRQACSKDAELETGIGDWVTTGSANKTANAPSKRQTTQVSKNPYALDDESDLSSDEEIDAPTPSSPGAGIPKTGAWCKPPTLTRQARKTWTPPASPVEESKGECWGDMSD